MSKPVFFDPTGKRAHRLHAIAWIVGTLSTIVLVVFAAILMTIRRPSVGDSFDQQVSPHMSIRCAWAPSCSPAHAITGTTAAHPELLSSASILAAQLREKERDLPHHPQAEVVDRHPVPVALKSSNNRPLSIGFYLNWDDNSYPALKRALPNLDWLIPGWLSLEGPNLELKTDVDDKVLNFIQVTKPNIPILPMIQNAAEGNWDGPGLARLLADPAARAARLNDIVVFLETNKFQGLTVDFEEVPPTSQNDLRAFLSEMSQAFKTHGLALVLAVPFDDDSWPYEAYGNIADYLLLMAYDQHWDGSVPGSIAGQD
jgi:peptidoglycan-N-acetylglucosamine deacetylase